MRKIKINEIYPLLKKRAKKLLNKISVRDTDISKLSRLSTSQIFYIKNQKHDCVSQRVAEKIADFLKISVDNINYKPIKYKNTPGRKQLKKAEKMLSVTVLNFMGEVKND